MVNLTKYSFSFTGASALIPETLTISHEYMQLHDWAKVKTRVTEAHFKALIYMHRYQPDLCSRLLNEYLHTFIGKLEAAKNTQTMFSLREDITGRENHWHQKKLSVWKRC